MDVYRYDRKTGDFKLYKKTDDDFDQIGKFKYDRKTKEYKPRLNKDGSIKTFSDHRGNNNKIAKGILRDGLNIKQRGCRFLLDDKKGPSLNDFYNFSLIFDEVAGVEISGYVFENPRLEEGQRYLNFLPYKDNSFYITNMSTSYDFGKENPIIHFHTHGHADCIEETKASALDKAFMKSMAPRYPGLQFLILHNYGTPIIYNK